MALINCKECCGKVSDKAKVCPHCGSKLRPKTTIFTWIVTILFFFVIYKWNELDTKNNEQSSAAKHDIKQVYTPPSSSFNSRMKSVVSYIDKFNVDAAVDFGVDINNGDNVVAENEQYKVLFETTANKIQFISVDIKRSSPCVFGRKIPDYKSYLTELGFNNSLLIRDSSVHSDSFIDQSNGVKVVVLCQYDGAKASVNISKI